MVRFCPFLIAALAVVCEDAGATEAANPSLEKEVSTYLAENPAPAPGDNTFKAFWKNGLNFETADKAFTAHIGGRILYDSAWFGSDDYGGAQTQDSWYMRQLWFQADGTLFTNAFYQLAIDFATGTPTLRWAMLGLKNLGPVGTFSAGLFKQPFSLSELESTRFITFMERSAPTQAFAPSYQNGFMLANNFLDEKRLLVAISAFKATTNGTATDNGGYAVAARVAAFFLEDKDSNRILHVGIGYVFADTPGGTKQYRARPDIGTGVRFVDTGAVTADDETVYCFEFLFTWQKLHVQAEYYWAELNGGGVDPNFQGFYAEVGYFLKGGRVNYGKEKKVLERPHIEDKFRAGGPGYGAWQVAIRYDSVDLSDAGVAGGLQEGFTFGVNWYWNPNMRVMFNVIWMDISEGGPFGEGSLTVFGTRFQVDF
jgi:phosphate-selective porin OprO/OprP